MLGVVVGEFSERQPVHPVILSMVDKDSEILFDSLIEVFCLSICLKVISRSVRG
jgi:hypothetical protein